MNAGCKKWLKTVPGILWKKAIGIQGKRIPWSTLQEEMEKKEPPRSVPEHSWVMILGGRYTSDIAFAESVTETSVSVWLLPRISYADKSNRKRRRTLEIPPYDLFDLEKFRNAYPEEPLVKSGPCIWTHNALHIEHGLIKKEFSLDRVIPWRGGMSLDAHWLFLHSEHPIIHLLNLPRPDEWSFAPSELTNQLSTGDKGYVVGMEQSYAWFRYANHTEDAPSRAKKVSWMDIVKVFQVGDTIQILTGQQEDEKGIVLEIQRWLIVYAPVNDNGLESDGKDSEREANVSGHWGFGHVTF